jgi:iron complex outermembrane receptor protein
MSRDEGETGPPAESKIRTGVPMTIRRGRRALLAFLVVPLLTLGVPTAGLSQSGRIAGTVQDLQGSPISGATVVATSHETGVSSSAVSGDDGRFTIRDLPAGAYRVTSTHGGLRATAAEVRVTPGGTARIDLVLEPVRVAELTVTAMLREQELLEVPFSVSAPTGDVLRSRGAEDLEAIAGNVPGFTLQNLGPGQSKPAIRGASSGQVFRDQPGVKEEVGVYLDDVPLALSLFTPDLDLFDVSRVEVLRGPQGTLFGSGSLAGTVRYITNRPELGSASFFGESGVETVDGGGIGGSLKLGANQPLGDRAALRVAAYRTEHAGYMDAVRPDLGVDDDVNSGRRSGVRAALLVQPTDRLQVTPRITYQRVERDGWNRIDAYNILANPYTTTRPPVTLGDREHYTALDEPFTDDFLLADVKLVYDLGGAELTSVTAHIDRDIHVVRDGGALWASFAGGTLGFPEPVYTLESPNDDVTDLTAWSQELRLAGEEGGISWVAGAFFTNRRRDFGQSAFAEGFTELTGIPTEGIRAAEDQIFYSDLSYDLTQFAVFGEATVPVTDRLNLTGGLRFYRFEEERDQIFDGLVTNDDLGNSLVSVPGDTEADGLAPRFIASYRPSDDVALNAQVSKGFRLGGINDPLNVPACTPEDLATFSGYESWKDETVWNYELGMKSSLLDGRASLDVSAYYLDIRDLQVTVEAGSCSSRLVFNVPDARSRGLEAELVVAPGEQLDLSVSASVNDAEVRSTLTSTGPGGEVSVVSGIEEGNRLPTVPEFQAAASATYRWTLASGTSAFVTGTYRHVGSRITQIGDQVEGFGTVNLEALPNTIGGPLTQSTFSFDPVLPAYDLLNFRLGVERGRWEVALVGRNLTDERAFLGLDRERGGLGRVGFLTNPPRTVGLQVRLGR